MLDSAEAVIRSKLDEDEQLLWSGQPRQGVFLQPQDAVLIPTSFLWGGFAFYWEYEVVTTHQFWVLQLWGIPFVLLGLYLVVGRFFADAYMRSKTFYGLTNKRAIIVRGSNTQSVPLSTLTGVVLGGDGTVVFGPPNLPPPMRYSAYMESSRVQYPMFQMIPDAQSVYDQIQAQRGSATATAVERSAPG